MNIFEHSILEFGLFQGENLNDEIRSDFNFSKKKKLKNPFKIFWEVQIW